MSSIAPSALRAAALAVLGPHTDARVSKVVREGRLSIDHDVSEWEASTGRMVAHRVRVGLTAALLGMVRAHPHVHDEVSRIISVAMASSDGDRVGEIVFHHDPRAGSPHEIETPYRGSHVPPEPPVSLDDASADWPALASAYLDASGERGAAALAARSRIELRSGMFVRVTLADEDAAPIPRDLTLVERCLRDLASGGPDAPIRFTFVRPPR